MESKAQIQLRIAGQVDQLSADQHELYSTVIQNRLCEQDSFKQKHRIGLYLSDANDVKTNVLFDIAHQCRKEIYIPAVNSNNALAYYRVHSLDQLTPVKGRLYRASMALSSLRDINMLNSIIVPGDICNIRGYRYVQEGDLFSKWLQSFQGNRVGLAYECQVLNDDRLFSKEKYLDWIITEERVIRCK